MLGGLVTSSCLKMACLSIDRVRDVLNVRCEEGKRDSTMRRKGKKKVPKRETIEEKKTSRELEKTIAREQRETGDQRISGRPAMVEERVARG